MSGPLTVPGWYRAGPRGLELAPPLEDPPEDVTDLVRAGLGEGVTGEPLW